MQRLSANSQRDPTAFLKKVGPETTASFANSNIHPGSRHISAE